MSHQHETKGKGVSEIVAQAVAEIEAEQRREQIEVEKERLRTARWWHRLFPWRITITKRTP